MHKKIVRTRRFRLFFESNWKDRPRPYWFNAKYPHDGSRRICVPFFTLDLYKK